MNYKSQMGRASWKMKETRKGQKVEARQRFGEPLLIAIAKPHSLLEEFLCLISL